MKYDLEKWAPKPKLMPGIAYYVIFGNSKNGDLSPFFDRVTLAVSKTKFGPYRNGESWFLG